MGYHTLLALVALCNSEKFAIQWFLMYGSLYVTLCFVLCRFYFGVLTFYFRILSFLFMCSVYDVVHFKRRHSRGRDKI